MHRSLNLNWVRSFEASARQLSFTDAAVELGMTPAAVSKHVRLLEQVVGEPLFLRLPRRLLLTDAGEAYLHVVADCLSALRRGTGEIFGVRQEGGLVTVRCNVGLATHWLARRLPKFLGDHPNVALRLLAVVHGSDAVWEGVDMELRYDGDHLEGFEAHPFKADALFPVCSPALRGSLAEPTDLLGQRLIHVIGNRHGWSEWFSLCGVQAGRPLRGVQVDTSATALSLAEAGVGVALGHSSLVDDLLASGRLVRPFELALEETEIFHLIRPIQGPYNPAAEAFASWVLSL